MKGFAIKGSTDENVIALIHKIMSTYTKSTRGFEFCLPDTYYVALADRTLTSGTNIERIREVDNPNDITIFDANEFISKYPIFESDKVEDLKHCSIEIVHSCRWDGYPECWFFGKIGYVKMSDCRKIEKVQETQSEAPIDDALAPAQPVIEQVIDSLAQQVIDDSLVQQVIDKFDIIPNESWNDKVELKISGKYELVNEDGKVFLVKKKPMLPTSLSECDALIEDKTPVDYIMSKLRELVICRNAYWKLLEWTPNLLDQTTKYTIENHHMFLTKAATTNDNTLLMFPTEESRDFFYETFNDLLITCIECL